MKIHFLPQRRDETFSYAVEGETGETIVVTDGAGTLVREDLSTLAEGDVAALVDAAGEPYPWAPGGARREAGEVVLGLLLALRADAPEAARFPVPVTVTAGPVPMPIQGA